VFSEDSICEGSCLQISSVTEQYPSTYLWTFDGARPGTSTAAQPGTICYDNAGKYQVKLVVSNAGGADTFTGKIVVTASPQPRFEDTSVTVKYKTSVALPACDNAWVMDWYLGDSLICQQCSFLQLEAKNWKTEYRCVVRNADCSDTCNYHVEVTDIPSDIWLPSAFSPNQDGKNDGFRVITDNPNVNIVDLSVYNRWGQRLFWSNDRNGWDGNYSGRRPADNGVYFWMVRYKIAGNTELFIKQGDVTLIR
jgi:gliding motility-associated-like protein